MSSNGPQNSEVPNDLISWRELIGKTPQQLHQESIQNFMNISSCLRVVLMAILIGDIAICLGGIAVVVILKRICKLSISCLILETISLFSYLLLKHSITHSLNFHKNCLSMRVPRIGLASIFTHVSMMLSIIICTDLHNGVTIFNIELCVLCGLFSLKAFIYSLILIIYLASQDIRKQLTKATTAKEIKI